MSRRIAKTQWKLPEFLKSDNGKTYPTDMVYWCYIYTEKGLKNFCKYFGFKQKEMERILEMTDWNDKKEQNRERAYRTYARNRLEKMERRQQIIDMLESHDLAALEQLVDDFEEKVRTDGYFVRDKDGNIVRDATGNPIMRMVPKFIKGAIQENIELLELNTRALIQANTTQKIPEPMQLRGEDLKQLEGEIIDLESMPIGEDEPENNK